MILEELTDDKSGFLYNMSVIFEAFKKERLYGITITETDQMYEYRAEFMPMFAVKCGH